MPTAPGGKPAAASLARCLPQRAEPDASPSAPSLRASERAPPRLPHLISARPSSLAATSTLISKRSTVDAPLCCAVESLLGGTATRQEEPARAGANASATPAPQCASAPSSSGPKVELGTSRPPDTGAPSVPGHSFGFQRLTHAAVGPLRGNDATTPPSRAEVSRKPFTSASASAASSSTIAQRPRLSAFAASKSRSSGLDLNT